MLAPGTVLGGCRLEAVIGRGGMGVVYRARQLDLDRDVAVKVIAPELVEDDQTRTRFLSEARAAGAVEHPNVVPVHGAGIAEGRAYLVMRYVAGDDLRTLVRRDGACSPRQAAEVAEQLGAALDAIHRAGYVHRDVKPQNVMIGADGHVYLSDFGLAKEALATSGPTTSEHWVGTLDYVAPEQIRGERIGPRADVYALGGVLCFMLTGRVPFDRPTDEAKLWAHLHDAPPVPSEHVPGLPPELDAVVARAMAKDPAARQASAGDLGRAARDAAEGRAPRSTVTARLPPTAARRLRRRAPWRAVAALGLLAAAGVLAIVLLGGGGGDDPRGTVQADATATPEAPAPDPRASGHYAVGERPRAVVVAGGAVWVLSIHEERLARLDPETGDPLGRQPFTGAGATALAADGDRVWVAKRVTGRVLAFDARTGDDAPAAHISVPGPPVAVAAGPSGLWVVARDGAPDQPATLYRYERSGTGVPWSHTFPDGVLAIALGEDAAWLALANRRLIRVRSGGEPEHINWLGAQAEHLAFGAGHLWASLPEQDAVVRVDPEPRGETPPAGVGRSPAGLVVSAGRLFVASRTRNRVDVLSTRGWRDPRRHRVPVDPEPYALAAGAGHVWVTSLSHDTVTRIDP
jgi:predicted Ser/Thr protein kinase